MSDRRVDPSVEADGDQVPFPHARRGCPDCGGAGGRWIGGPFPEMEGCWCIDEDLDAAPLCPGREFPAEPPF